MNLNYQDWDLKQRILATVAYFNDFEIALSRQQLMNLLLGKMANLEEIDFQLNKLNDQIERVGEYLVLKNGFNPVAKSAEKLERIKVIDKRINDWKWVFKFIPFLNMAAICNYTSLGDVKKDSDIDVFVVTKKGRINLAKVFLTLTMQVLGVRRHGKKISERFCLSFFVTDEALNVESVLIENDIYFAYWMLALRPVYAENKIWDLFWLENSWLENYFERRDRLKLKINVSAPGRWKRFLERMLDGKFGDWLEKLLAKYFLSRYLKKKSSLPVNALIVVSDKMLKYHNNDAREIYRDRWINQLKRLGSFN